MRVEGVDLLEPLVEAHAKSRLALFIGAGASTDPPADLPRFSELACEIASRTVGSCLDESDPARLLDRLCNEYDVNAWPGVVVLCRWSTTRRHEPLPGRCSLSRIQVSLIERSPKRSSLYLSL